MHSQQINHRKLIVDTIISSKMRGKKIEEMELPLEIRKIGEGDVRNVYLVEAPQARFVLKEWKNKASKADQISIYEKLKLEEKECEKYFKTYASVLSELIVNNLDEMTDVQLSYLLTIQEYVEPSNNLQNIKKKLADLLDYTYERLMLATTGETVIFPDLNIDNFILASDKIFFIDCSIYRISILPGEFGYRIENVLHDFVRLKIDWLGLGLEDIKIDRQLNLIKSGLIAKRGIKFTEEIFDDIEKGNLHYWENE